MRVSQAYWLAIAYFFLCVESVYADGFVDESWPYIRERLSQSEQRGNYKSALHLLDRYITLRREQSLTKDFLLAAALRQRARLSQLSGEKQTKLAPLWEAISIDTEAFGRDHPIIAYDYVAIADALTVANELQEAQGYYMQAIRILMAAYGPSHPLTDATFQKLGRVFGPLEVIAAH